MAYVSPGGAFSSAIQDALLARDSLQLKHQELDIQERQLARETAKDIADQQARAAEDKETAHQNRVKEVTEELKDYQMGDILPPELLKKAKDVGVAVPGGAAPEANPQGAAAIVPGAPMGTGAAPVPMRFAGTPQQRQLDSDVQQALTFAATLPKGPEREALEYEAKTGFRHPAPAGMLARQPLTEVSGMMVVGPNGKEVPNAAVSMQEGKYLVNGQPPAPGQQVVKRPAPVDPLVEEEREARITKSKEDEAFAKSTMEMFDKDPRALNAAALSYKTTNQLPALTGMSPVINSVKLRIMQRKEELNDDGSWTDPKTGVTWAAGANPALLGAEYKANVAALTKATQNLAAVKTFARTADRNQDLLNKTLKGVPDTGVTLLNKPIRDVVKALGSDNQAAFAVMMPSLRAEYARLINQPNLTGVLSDTARKEVGTTLPDDATVGQIKTALKFLKDEGQNRVDSTQDMIKELNDAIKGEAQSSKSISTPATAESLADEFLKKN